MSHVTFVRHGQANNSARDEEGYDKLSDLGWKQSRWLGEHFGQMNEVFARVYTGTLRRHVETTEGINANSPEAVIQDERLNELQYFTMATLFEAQHGEPLPNGREEFAAHLPKMFRAWQEGAIDGVPESFQHFEKRVNDVVREIGAGKGRALVVTSGGVIGMALRVTMSLDLKNFCHACLSIQNTSVHRMQPMPTGMALVQFNATPHLETTERQFAQTHL
ncbi:histidine phosphatase family protein [Pseudoprimorskyibacter insulae]|uniref:2,3-bisphosphoglycerate-dependent phosphoglycerate mutase n=1 Tax=Pseudoprimorskyibacter insulae TaxID=1695997 RepID=A0A2R8AN76_9RHOB|nr:histidine phosphatase family protein [Pseudoprimorskyibacter insulae]SPF77496.1 2,3-bisphosphoglycerate-dependent phosphoglycerate mutase [Pseudoprimorskyibacter insulae]